ncbi:Opacity protein [Cribrihabitans marinus]|uniref:Opacity protein n=1 Tax=Cribrihabitans marinus TaxID=1227549 RepID=A0A1H7CLS9_9RHOB|nr:outer membrane beta-barrel protein [Cribrihabitans marinus]GGH35993.1 membrane protein [Cribrihabitans marinus]SEJ90638.1 Opacity protein [Cribrihabitans marinus]
MKYALPFALAFTGVTATSALAGNLEPAQVEPAIAPAPVPASTSGDWGGFYAGGQLGYGFGSLDLDPRNIDDLDTDGIVGGLTLGYLWDLGNWVVGPELQYDFSDLSVDEPSGSGSFDGIARLKARAGYDLGRSMVYGSAGVAYTNFDGLSGVNDIDLDDPGYVVGIGYDYQVNDSWVVGGEYQHHVFDDFGADGNDVDFGTVHLRATYQF